MKLKRPSAFSLVEVVLALGLVTFCIVSLLGLLSVGLKTEKTNFEETQAINILGLVSTDLRCSTNTLSSIYGLGRKSSSTGTIPTIYLTEAGAKTNVSNARYALSGTYLPPATASEAPMTLLLSLAWPASAGTNTQERTETLITIPRENR